MIRLTRRNIEFMHDRMILKYGGELGIREEGTLDMLCEQSYQSFLGDDLYPSVFDKAAKYVEGFATHQVFYDGNKRTGLETMIAFLGMNGYDFTLDNTKTYDFVMRIANDKTFTLEQISAVIEQNCQNRENTLDYDFDDR